MKKYWILFSAMFSFLMFVNDLHKLWLLLSEKEGIYAKDFGCKRKIS